MGRWDLDGSLPGGCRTPLRNQIPLAALSITDKEDGMVGVAGGGGRGAAMSSLQLH